MKIIAKSKTGFLLEATEGELKMAMGHNRYADSKDTGTLDIGYDVPVTESFEQLEALRGVRRQLDDATKKLRESADAIEAIKTPSVGPMDLKRTR